METETEKNNKNDFIYSNSYKNLYYKDQNKRRQNLLEERKRKRDEIVELFRNINVIENICFKYNECNYKLMFSEWMLEVPTDLETSWLFRIVPVGRRCLVVTKQNKARIFSRKGKFLFKIKSPFSRIQLNKKESVLDCIWNDHLKKFYVLDLIIWGDSDLTNYNTELRFFWMKSRIEEVYLSQVINRNDYIFETIEYFPCKREVLAKTFAVFPYYPDNTPPLDGVLFYHKDIDYTPGNTPLVGWLKPYMLPEILNISVANEYFLSKPKNYVSLAHKINNKTRKKVPMEVDT